MNTKRIRHLLFFPTVFVLTTGLWAQSLPSMKSLSYERSRAREIIFEALSTVPPGASEREYVDAAAFALGRIGALKVPNIGQIKETIRATRRKLAAAGDLELKNEMASALEKLAEPESTYAVLFAGEVKNAIENPDADKSSFGLATFGISRTDKRMNLTLLIKVADSQAPVQEDFGRALLNPAGLENASGYVDFAYSLCSNRGLYGRAYGTIATNKWQAGQGAASDATILTFGVGFYKNLWKETIEKASVHPEIESNVFLGFTARCIAGDLGFEENTDLRKSLLGSEQRFFAGGEIYWDIFFRGIKGYADITWFPFPDNIPGFSNWRLTAGIGLQLDILRFEKYASPGS